MVIPPLDCCVSNHVTTPIYALTAHAMKGIEKSCHEAGCTGYLTKPIEIDKLLAIVGQELNGQRVKSDKVVQLNFTTNQDSVGRGIVSSLPRGIPEFEAIIESFSIRLAEKIDKLDVEVENGNFKQIEQMAHWLKGSGGTVGFNQFTEPAKRLEQYSKQHDTNEIMLTLDEIRELCSRIQPAPPVAANSESPTNSTEAPVSTAAINDHIQESQPPSTCFDFLPIAHAQIQRMLDAWQHKDYEELQRLAEAFATETEALSIASLPNYSRSMALLALEKNNDEIHSIFLRFCKWAERAEAGNSTLIPMAPTTTNPAAPLSNISDPSLMV